MLSLYRGLLAGFLVAGLAALCYAPSDMVAQDAKDKKDTKDAKDKEKAKEDIKEKSVGIATSDGLSLNGYWFQGTGIEKQRPDAVMMFPAPGGKVNDSWIALAKALSEKNFSVLLFDWRGMGMNGPDGIGQGSRIFSEKDEFWKERYNGTLLMNIKATVEKNGLDWAKVLSTKSNGSMRYRDFMLNDLMAARFFLDKQNDAGRCNTNRVWIVSEKEGAHLGLAFVASEFQRHTIHLPKKTTADIAPPFKGAGKDYAGIMALSYSGSNSPTASMVYKNALPSIGANDEVKKAKEHLEERLAMVLMYSKKETGGQSNGLMRSVGVAGSEDEMKKKFKYPKEFDIKAMKPISGIDMIDQNDSFGVKAYIVKAMVEISKVQNFGKDPTERDAAKTTEVPRIAIEKFNR
jgi:hypothetical protein